MRAARTGSAGTLADALAIAKPTDEFIDLVGVLDTAPTQHRRACVIANRLDRPAEVMASGRGIASRVHAQLDRWPREVSHA